MAVLVAGLDIATQWETTETRSLAGGLRIELPLAALAVVGYLPLVWRRRAPMRVFGLVWLHSLVCHLLVPGYRPTFAVLVALYTVAALRPVRWSLIALAGGLAVSALSLTAEYRLAPGQDGTDTIVVGFLLFSLLDLVVWGGGRAVALSRRERALLEAARDHAAQEAVRRERTQLALELHDVVAHSVTLMVLEAAAAGRLVEQQPSAPVRGALAGIEATGAQTITELRGLLELLDGSTRKTAEAPPVVGMPLDEIVQRVRNAGLKVNVRTTGAVVPLDPAVDLAAHRVVQEGLTNALRYAGVGATVTLDMSWRNETLTISVRDDGSGWRDPAVQLLSAGRGLQGLRDRVAESGGTLIAANSPDGGFELVVTLPIRESAGTNAVEPQGSRRHWPDTRSRPNQAASP